MALTKLWGYTEAQLLAGLTSAQADYTSGLMIQGATAAEIQRQNQIQKNASERIDLFQRALYEFDPVKYVQFARVGFNQTIASFNISVS